MTRRRPRDGDERRKRGSPATLLLTACRASATRSMGSARVGGARSGTGVVRIAAGRGRGGRR
uniref:Uncharacterized protein n=1 Tax=Oryza barthii TaxID=65489 RepID=A0A0D3GRK4_9ORYZ